MATTSKKTTTKAVDMVNVDSSSLLDALLPNPQTKPTTKKTTAKSSSTKKATTTKTTASVDKIDDQIPKVVPAIKIDAIVISVRFKYFSLFPKNFLIFKL